MPLQEISNNLVSSILERCMKSFSACIQVCVDVNGSQDVHYPRYDKLIIDKKLGRSEGVMWVYRSNRVALLGAEMGLDEKRSQ